MEKTNLKISEENKNERLDKFVLSSIPSLSRTRIQNLIEEGNILLNGEKVKSGCKLRVNDKIEVSIPEPRGIDVKPEKIPLDVVLEDKDIIVINKAHGMVTHPGSGVETGTLVNALLHHCKKSLSGINGVLRPGIVHRLDKETSGLIIVCKNDESHVQMAKQFHDRTLEKYYYAIVCGQVKFTQGKINKPIGRDKNHRHKMGIEQDGKEAITHWKIIKIFDDYTFLECRLETGRTHQIRVHMASIGHPIVGDKTYGKKKETSPMMLHSYKIKFSHPITNEKIELETDIPKRFNTLISK
jgi:23S rRNA pseudouridine1911/1915/1917 synthase